MLTSAEVCERLRISDRTLRSMVARGDIKAIRTGPGNSPFRFTEEALADYIERQTVEVKA